MHSTSTIPLTLPPPDHPPAPDPHRRPVNPDGLADFGATTLDGDGLGV